MLAVLPLFHAYGLTVTTLLPLTEGRLGGGARALCSPPDSAAHRKTSRLLPHRRARPVPRVDQGPHAHRLQLASGCASPEPSACPSALPTTSSERFNYPLVQGYGTTELSPVVSFSPPDDNCPGSVGRPLPNIQVTIRGEKDEILATGEIGEVCVSGPSVMLGYLGDPQATAQKIRNGVLHTGDKGYLNAEGFLFLLGRADDLVKVSGEQVYPSEVENALETIDGVEEAAVIAFPDEKHGARLHAFVQLQPGATLTDTALRASCREMLEHLQDSAHLLLRPADAAHAQRQNR